MNILNIVIYYLHNCINLCFIAYVIKCILLVYDYKKNIIYKYVYMYKIINSFYTYTALLLFLLLGVKHYNTRA